MADPILPDHFRAQWIWQGISGLPEDRYVNSWAFRNDLPLDDPAARIAALLSDFYQDVHAPATSALTAFVPSAMVTATAEVRVYDLGDPAPREPTIIPVGVAGLSAATPLPGEVATCLSYVADRNLPRNRGRIYFGPLGAGANGTVIGGHLRPSASLLTSLVEGANFLINNTVDLTWVMISQADANAKVITGGWVDNAFDTQRRRGGDPSARTNYGTEL